MYKYEDCAVEHCVADDSVGAVTSNVLGSQVVTFPTPANVLNYAAKLVQEELKTIADTAKTDLEAIKLQIDEEEYAKREAALPPQPPTTITLTGVDQSENDVEAIVPEEELHNKNRCVYFWVD